MSQGPCGHQSKHCRCPVFCLVIIWLSCFFMGLLDADDWFKHLFHLSILRPVFVGTQQKPSETLAPMVFLLASDITFATHQAGNAWGVVVIVSEELGGWWFGTSLISKPKRKETHGSLEKKHTSDSHFLEDLNHLFSTRSCPTWPISNIPRGIFLQSLKNQKGPLGPGPLGPLGTIYWDSHGK